MSDLPTSSAQSSVVSSLPSTRLAPIVPSSSWQPPQRQDARSSISLSKFDDAEMGLIYNARTLPGESAVDAANPKPERRLSHIRTDAVIQWETAAFYTFEAEVDGQPVPFGEPEPPITKLTLGIVRLGSSKGVSRVKWSTFNKDAIAGKNYVQVVPQWVEFGDGVSHVDVTVEIKSCPTFDGTVEFGLHIDEHSVENASVGKYLFASCVKIIDRSAFPSDGLRDSVAGGNPEKIGNIPSFVLVVNFLKLCWSNPVTRRGSIKTILAYQWHSLVAVLNILLMLFIVRTVSGTGSDDEKRSQIVIFGLLWVVPFFGSHALNYSQQFWKVSGSLKAQLQMLLLKKFLNYTDDSRSCVAIEKLMMALVRDVTTAVLDGYNTALSLVFGTLFRVGYLVLTMVYIQTLSGSRVDYAPIAAIFLLPLALLVFLYLRQKTLFELREKQFEAESLSIHHVIKTVLNYQLIQDYDRTSFVITEYQKFLAAVNKKTTDINSSIVNSKAMAPWLTTLLVGGYIIFGGSHVVSGSLPLATFLSTISLFRAVGGEFEKGYTQSLAITSAYASISQLTVFMNLPVDVPMRRKISRARRGYGKEFRKTRRGSLEESLLETGGQKTLDPVDLTIDDLPVDLLPIVLSNISFSYLASNPLRASEHKIHVAARADQHLLDDLLKNPYDSIRHGINHIIPTSASMLSHREHSMVAPDAYDATKHVQKTLKEEEEEAHMKRHSKTMLTFIRSAQPRGIESARAKVMEKAGKFQKAATKIQAFCRSKLAQAKHKQRLVEGGGLKHFSMELPQGKIVAIVGPPTSGKATILRLLANQIFPNVDEFSEESVHEFESKHGYRPAFHLVPPHLRVVQVSETPMILGPQESIFDNLIFGIKLTPSTNLEELELRARKVMKRLNFTPSLLEHHFKQKGFIGAEGCRITRTNRQLISLGRALVMNPEVLIVHKPDCLFSDSFSEILIKVFREFVDDRGVCMPPESEEPLARRRRRTLIFTPTEEQIAKQADVVFEAKGGKVKKKSGHRRESMRENNLRPEMKPSSPSKTNGALEPILDFP